MTYAPSGTLNTSVSRWFVSRREIYDGFLRYPSVVVVVLSCSYQQLYGDVLSLTSPAAEIMRVGGDSP